MDVTAPAGHRVKMKDKYLGLDRELKKLWKIKGTLITIAVGVLGTVHKIV